MKKEAYWSLSAVSMAVALGCLGALLMAGFIFESDPATDITLKERWIFEGGFFVFLSLSILFAFLGRKRRRNAFKQNPGNYTLGM
jgi:hypothetical protein